MGGVTEGDNDVGGVKGVDDPQAAALVEYPASEELFSLWSWLAVDADGAGLF